MKEAKLCRRCLKSHFNQRCSISKPCEKDGCQLRHHPLLHVDQTKNTTLKKDLQEVTNPTIQQADCQKHSSNNHSTLFRILPVKLHGNNITIETFAFLDDGSSLSLIEERIAHQLQLKGQNAPLRLDWTADTYCLESESRIVSMYISAQTN